PRHPPVARPRDRAVTWRRASAHTSQGAGGDRCGDAQPWSALADGEAVVDGEGAGLGRLATGERTEVRGAVVTDLPDDGQPWEGFIGDLNPLGAFRKLRPTVVTRGVTADQPQLGYIGLQLGDARYGFHSGSQPDHLVDPRPLLGSGEIVAHPSPDVLGFSDVENVTP